MTTQQDLVRSVKFGLMQLPDFQKVDYSIPEARDAFDEMLSAFLQRLQPRLEEFASLGELLEARAIAGEVSASTQLHRRLFSVTFPDPTKGAAVGDRADKASAQAASGHRAAAEDVMVFLTTKGCRSEAHYLFTDKVKDDGEVRLPLALKDRWENRTLRILDVLQEAPQVLLQR